jgi:lysozyme
MPMMPRKSLIAAVGLTTATLITTYVPQFEGELYIAAPDPIGIITACNGHTKDVDRNHTYTKEECAQLLEGDALDANDVVDRCITVPLTPGQRFALVDFVINVGPGKDGVKDGLCVLRDGRQPQLRQRFNRGDYAGGCRALTEGWNTARGIFLPGLATRRKKEREICETVL